MKVVVIGASGQVGYELINRASDGFEVVGLASSDLDITDEACVNKILCQLQPQVIINAAAYTAVDKAEIEKERAYKVNELGVKYLALFAKQQSIPIIHVSTDYVFDGMGDKPYQENDPTAPIGVYGASKHAGELILNEYCPQHIILRTSWVFGSHGDNFVKTMLRLGFDRKSFGVVDDQQGCPTSAASIADVLWLITRHYKDNQNLPWGVYHFSNQSACSWFDFATEIFRQAINIGILDSMPKVKAITTEDYPTPAKRPMSSILDCQKIYKQFGINQPSWNIELGYVLGSLRQS